MYSNLRRHYKLTSIFYADLLIKCSPLYLQSSQKNAEYDLPAPKKSKTIVRHERFVIQYINIVINFNQQWTETFYIPPLRPKDRAISSKDSSLPQTPTSWTLSAAAAMKLQSSSATHKLSSLATTARTSCPSLQAASANSQRVAPLRSKPELIVSNFSIIAATSIIYQLPKLSQFCCIFQKTGEGFFSADFFIRSLLIRVKFYLLAFQGNESQLLSKKNKQQVHQHFLRFLIAFGFQDCQFAIIQHYIIIKKLSLSLQFCLFQCMIGNQYSLKDVYEAEASLDISAAAAALLDLPARHQILFVFLYMDEKRREFKSHMTLRVQNCQFKKSDYCESISLEMRIYILIVNFSEIPSQAIMTQMGCKNRNQDRLSHMIIKLRKLKSLTKIKIIQFPNPNPDQSSLSSFHSPKTS